MNKIKTQKPTLDTGDLKSNAGWAFVIKNINQIRIKVNNATKILIK